MVPLPAHYQYFGQFWLFTYQHYFNFFPILAIEYDHPQSGKDWFELFN